MKTKILKSPFFLILFGLLILSGSCKKLGINHKLRVDFVSFFNNAPVIVKLNDEVIFSDKISSSGLLPFARIITVDYPIGRYELSVSINGTEKKVKFRHKKDRVVTVNYSESISNILILFPKEAPDYN